MLSRQFGRLLAIAAAIASVPLAANAQSVITGRVVERASQRPIPDVSVRVSGTTVGARTNEQGVYRIVNVPAGEVVLRATRIGFAASTRTVTATNGLVDGIDFALEPAATILDEVVTNAVTGQAESRRSQGTNVGNIDASAIEKAQITKFTDVLTGRTAGVTVQGTSGTAGTGQRIHIRGANSLSLSNEPLIYVDGTQISNGNLIDIGLGGQAVSRLNDIASEDIESIEVLKGPAATAMYGTSAANGVLLITTKRGRAGVARWNAFAESGSEKDVTDYPNNYVLYHLVTPGAPLVTTGGGYNTTDRTGCLNYLRAQALCTYDSAAVFNTLTDKRTTPFVTGSVMTAGLNVAGGGDQTQYYLGVDNQTEHGVVEFNTLRKLAVRANMNTSLNKKLDFSLSSGYTRSNGAFPQNDNSIFSPLINGLVGTAFYYAPTSTQPQNPLNYRQYSVRQLAEYVAHQDIDHFTVGTIGNYRPLSWLTGNANLGLDYYGRYDYLTLQPGKLPIAASYVNGNRTSTHGGQYLYTGTGSLSARFEPLETLRSTTTAGASYSRSLTQSTYGFGAGIVAGTQSLGASSSLFSVDEGFSEIISIGAFGREELAWRDRVFLAASLRADDNSAFGFNFNRIYYPGVNASWVVADEPWFPKTNYLSSLRLRAAYGRSGQRPNFRDATTYFGPTSVQIGTTELPAVTLGTTLSGTGNLALKPEKTDEYEFGADIGFWKDRASFQVTSFQKRSTDALIRRNLQPSSGLTASRFENLGGIGNRGIETQLDLQALQTDRVELNVHLTASTLKNRIIALGKGVAPISLNRGLQLHRAGYSAGSFWQRPVYYNDANKDGLLAPSEVTLGDTSVYMGPSLPTWNRSASADIRLFKVVRVSTLFEGRGGNKTANYGEYFRCGSSSAVRGCAATGAVSPSLKEQAAYVAAYRLGARGTSTALYVENGGFVKWRELAVTLEAPASWVGYVRTAGVSGVNLTFAGRNLHTWTSYTGLDPEIIEAGTSLFNQSEFNTQPTPRYYTARLSVTF